MIRTYRSPLAIALVVALVVAACGTNNGSGAAGGASGAPPSAAGSQAAGSPAESGGASPAANLSGDLTVWAMGNEGTKLSALADAFMKDNPNVKVSVTPVDWGQAVAKLQTAIAGNTTPDVSQMGTDMMGQFGATGAFDPVPADIDPSAFFQSAWNTNQVGGAACHEGFRSCFFRKRADGEWNVIGERVFDPKEVYKK